MAKTPGFIEYVDDRDAKSEWFEVARIDSNGVSNSYLFSKANYQSFKQLMAKHDAEFNTWMAGVQ